MTGTLLTLVLVAAFAASFVGLRVLHPLQIWFGSWALAAASHSAQLLPFRPLSGATAAIVLAAGAAFTAGTLIGERLGTTVPAAELRGLRNRAAAGAALSFALTIAGLALFLAQVTERFGFRDAVLVSADVRHALISQDGLDAYRYIHAAMASTVLCALAASQDAKRRVLWLALATLSVATLYFSTGRQLVVFAVIAALAIFGLPYARRLRRTHVLAAGAVVGMLAIGIVIAVGTIIGDKYSNNDLATFENPFAGSAAGRELGAVYVNASGSIAAFNEQVAISEPWGRAYGCATFPVACHGLDLLGIDNEPEPRVRPFTAAPVPWNTYTFLDAPLIDFGPYLAPLAIGLLGLAIGFVWALASRGVAGGLIAYSVAAAMLAFAGRQNLAVQALEWGLLALALMWLGAALASATAPLRTGRPWSGVRG